MAERRKNAANNVMQKYAKIAMSSMRFVPNLPARRPYAIAEGNATNCVTNSASTSWVEPMPRSVP